VTIHEYLNYNYIRMRKALALLEKEAKEGGVASSKNTITSSLRPQSKDA
jgi:hypothetical protein